jgi:hypothetical protein
MRARTKEEHEKLIKRIEKIMDPDKRIYLTAFRINSDLNLKQTILQAIFKGNSHFQMIFCQSVLCFIVHFARLYEDKRSDKQSRSTHNDENTQKEHLLKLAIKWNCFDQATDLLEELQYIDVTIYFSRTNHIYLFFSEPHAFSRTVQASSR